MARTKGRKQFPTDPSIDYAILTVMSEAPTIDADARRREAGEFLRSRRERLVPSDVGLSDGFRRRTPGLRREEVAMLAGVGTTWYTWLEQGRDVKPSNEVLSALSGALQLDPTERRHLFVLHDRPLPDPRSTGVERINEPLRRMLDSLTGQPAYVLGRRWDVLAWNRAAEVVYGPYGRLEGDERNTLHLIFTDPDHRRLLVDWEAVARASLAMFRADYARHTGNPDFMRLIAHLTRQSTEFAQWWPQREVARPLAGQKRINHPTAGQMLFEYSSLGVGDLPDMKLIVFTPLDDSGKKLEQLLRDRPR
jgi:transcriptional regulator with XRE-family HTH domain